MNVVNFPVKPAAKRKAKRDRQYANTLVHYLGVRKAIIEQAGAAVR
jgi:hypothetical protein